MPAYCDRVVFRDSFDGSNTAMASRLMRPAKVTVIRYDYRSHFLLIQCPVLFRFSCGPALSDAVR